MTQWMVEYYHTSKFDKWFKSLGKEKFQAVYELVRALSELGNELGLPFSKSLGKGLFELRERQYGLRIYYTFKKGRVILLLQGGDKSSQDDDIKKCYKILKHLD